MARDSLIERVDLQRLKASIDKDYLALEPYRANMVKAVREFCGPNYSANGTVEDKPFNLLSLFVRIVTDYLCGSDPRVMASTDTREIRPYAKTMQDWTNKQLVRMKFRDVLRRSIRSALFLMGWTKTCLTAPTQARFGYGKATGEVSMSNIAFEDMIFDARAKSFYQCDYIGHYYDVFFDDVKASTLFDKKQKLKVVPRQDRTMTDTGDERIAEIGAGGMANNEEYYKKARLGEVWLRRENLVVTFDANGDFEKPLMVQKWVGPECGPYHCLTFGEVPDNLMPKAPVMDLISVDKSFNLLHCKLDNQASRQKINPVFRDAEMGKVWQDAHDGQPIYSPSPDAIGELKTGGADNGVATWAMMQYNLFSEYAGNLKSLGGLASQSDTATQEKLVHQSASNLVQAMGGRVIDFAQELMEALAWFNWNSPRATFTSSYQVPGVPEVSIPRTVTPQQRFHIPFEEVNITLDTYSLVHQTPQMRKNALDEMYDRVMKTLPMFGQPGVKDFVALYFSKTAGYTNNPDWNEMWEALQGIEGPPAGDEQAPEQPQTSPDDQTTTNVRISKPGMNDQAHAQLLQQMLAGGQPAQGAQGNGLGQMRQVG